MGGVLLGGEAESRTLCAFMSDFSLSSVYLTASLFVLPHGTSKPIASGTVIPKIFAVRFSAALFFLLEPANGSRKSTLLLALCGGR